MISDPRLEAIRQREVAATKGPWRIRARVDRGGDLSGTDTLYEVCAGAEEWHDNEGHFHPDDARFAVDAAHVAACSYDRDYGYPEGGIARLEDAEFIAHAREDIPYLLSLLDASERRINELEKTLGLHGGEVPVHAQEPAPRREDE